MYRIVDFSRCELFFGYTRCELLALKGDGVHVGAFTLSEDTPNSELGGISGEGIGASGVGGWMMGAVVRAVLRAEKASS